MKQKLILLFLVFLPLSLYAQAHLTFQEVPINGTVSSFVTQLKRKGIKPSQEDDYEPFILKGVETVVYVNRYIKSNTVCKVSIWYIFPDTDKGLKDFSNCYISVCKQIESQYICKKNEYYDSFFTGYFCVYDVTSKTNKNIKIGEIEVDKTISNGNLLVSVTYSDHINSINNKLESYPQNNTNLKWIDFSHLVNGEDKCFLSLTSNSVYVKYDKRKNGNLLKEHFLVFREDDMKTLILLFGECKNGRIKKDLFNKYISSALADYDPEYKNATYLYINSLDDITRDYYEKYKQEISRKQKRNQGYQFTSVQFLKMLCPNFLTDKEYEFAETFLPPDFLTRAFKAISSNSNSYDEFMRNASFATKKELGIK